MKNFGLSSQPVDRASDTEGMTMSIRRVLSALAVSAAAGMGFLVLSTAPASAGPIYYCNGVKQYTPCPPKEPMECVPVKNGTHCYPVANPPKTAAPKPPPPPAETTPAGPPNAPQQPAPPVNQPGTQPAPDRPAATQPDRPDAPNPQQPTDPGSESPATPVDPNQVGPEAAYSAPADATDLAFANDRLRPRAEWIAL